MPEFDFTIGDKKVHVKAPEGTTKEQAFGRAVNRHVQKHGPLQAGATPENVRDSVKKEMEGSNLWDQFWSGVGNFGIEGAQQVRQMLGGDVSEQEIQEVRGLTDTGMGKFGNFAGNVLATAVPLGAAEKALKARTLALPKAVGAAARVAAPVGIGAVEAGLTQPVAEGESKLAQMAIGGAAGGAGEGIVRGGQRVAEGVARKSKLGEELFDKGYTPTVGQGSEGIAGTVLGTGENIMSAMGISGLGMNRVGREMVDKLSKEVDTTLSKYGQTIGELPARSQSYFDKGTKAFDAAYDKILSGRSIKLPALMITNTVRDSSKAFKFARANVRNAFYKDLERILPQSPTRRIGGRKFKDIRAELNKNIRKYSSSQMDNADEVVDAYRAALKHFDIQGKKGFPRQVWKDMLEVDDAYAKFSTFGDAAGGRGAGVGEGAQGGRVLTAKNVVDSVEKRTPDNLLRSATGRQMKETEPVRELMAAQGAKGALARKGSLGLSGLALGYGTAGPVALIPAAVGLAGMSKPGAKALMGETKPQKVLSKALRDYLAPYGGTAGAVSDLEED